MISQDLYSYINIRNGQLSWDEILHVIDGRNNPNIDHIEYNDNTWSMWDKNGNSFSFTLRDW